MFQANKQKPNFVSWWIKERMPRASLCEVHKPSALLCNQQHKCFPRGQHWTVQVCAGTPAQEPEAVAVCTGNSLLRYLSSSCCAVQVPGLLQGQWEPSLRYLSHPQLPSAGALLFLLFLSEHLKCTSCSLKFAAHHWKCKLGSLWGRIGQLEVYFHFFLFLKAFFSILVRWCQL